MQKMVSQVQEVGCWGLVCEWTLLKNHWNQAASKIRESTFTMSISGVFHLTFQCQRRRYFADTALAVKIELSHCTLSLHSEHLK